MSPRSLIRPSRIASSVPMSMSGTRPSSAMDWSGPLGERFKPSLSIEPIANRITGAFSASATRGGSHCSAAGKKRIGTPKSSRGTTLTGLRTERVTSIRGFGEVERDLGAGIAVADDQHAFAGERSRIAIAARMQDRAAERLDAGPCRRMGIVGPAGRDDDDGRGSRVLARLGAPRRARRAAPREQAR